MKSKNFPGRKNDRRRAALKRLGTGISLVGEGKKEREQRALMSSIMSNDAARSIRTKKDRSARGKLRA
jgi:hypothetical protein